MKTSICCVNRRTNNNRANNDRANNLFDYPPFDPERARAHAQDMYNRRNPFHGDAGAARGNPLERANEEQIPMRLLNNRRARGNEQQGAPIPPPPPPPVNLLGLIDN